MDARRHLYQEVLFDKVPTPLFRISRQNDQFIFIDSNTSGQLLTRGAITNLYERDVDEIWSQAENRHIAEAIHTAHRSHQPVSETFWHTFVSDGQPRYINIVYVPVGPKDVMLFLYDLTNSHQTIENALRGSAKYEALFQRSRLGLIEGTPEHFMDCNQELADLLGFTREELLGLSLRDLSHPEDLHNAFNAIRNLESQPLSVQGWTGRAIRKDGQEPWCKVSITGVVDDAGQLSHYIASVADVSARMVAELKARAALAGIIKAVAATVDARDAYTAGHMTKVSQYAVAIGTALGMDAEQMEGLRLGALIHDIGKISIPIDILNKPSTLNDTEFALVKGHSRVGSDILKDIDFPWPIRAMILQHHERPDGSGYPDGLHADDILQEARIIGVADVLEAVTSHRPYRPAYPLDKALEILRQERGRLDPELVDMALALVEKGTLVVH